MLIIDGFFHIAPIPLRGFVARQARKQVEKTYFLHGLGRHSQQEQHEFARRDLQALQALQAAVGGDGFLFSAEPCVFDFTIASFMAGVYDQQPPTWLTYIAEDYTRLKRYTEDVQAHVGVYGRATM